MKRILSVFMASVLCAISATVITSATAEAVDSAINIVSGDVEYTVEFEDTTLTEEQQQAIAESLVNGENCEAHTYGLVCTLFGHDIEESTVSVITHKVKTTSPRCKRQMYQVTICNRCDYQTQELSGTSYIVCCPVD